MAECTVGCLCIMRDVKCNVPESVRFRHKGIGVIIGRYVKLGTNIDIYPHVIIGSRCDDYYNPNATSSDMPTIEDNVILLPHSSVVGKVTVGKGSIVGAFSLVLDDVPPNSLVAGIPAKVLKSIKRIY